MGVDGIGGLKAGRASRWIDASFLNITFSFLNYKWFIFRTKGNYLREWLRCVLVYGTGSLIGTALLGPLVFAFKYVTGVERSAPYIAGALLTAIMVPASFLGHKNYSFVQTGAKEI